MQLLQIAELWQRYLDAIAACSSTTDAEIPSVWSFGDSKQMADELGHLVYYGIKTATCSLLWEYEADGEALPEVRLSIITDGKGNPLCIIETINVHIVAYGAVDAEFADAEGEGDRTLTYWRTVHWQFFSDICQALNRVPNEAMPLVCEQFRVVFKAESQSFERYHE